MIFGYRFLFPVHSEWDVVHLSKYMQNSSKCEYHIKMFKYILRMKRAWIDYQIEVQKLIRLLYVPMIHMHRKIRIKKCTGSTTSFKTFNNSRFLKQKEFVVPFYTFVWTILSLSKGRYYFSTYGLTNITSRTDSPIFLYWMKKYVTVHFFLNSLPIGYWINFKA